MQLLHVGENSPIFHPLHPYRFAYLCLNPPFEILVPPESAGKQDSFGPATQASRPSNLDLRFDKAENFADNRLKQGFNLSSRYLELAPADGVFRRVWKSTSGYEELLLGVSAEVTLDLRFPASQRIRVVSVVPTIEARELLV